MRLEVTEVEWLEQKGALSAAELAELSGLSEPELMELVNCGVLEPLDASGVPQTFTGTCIVVARTARRLRQDFELDFHGVALVLTLLDRVHDLESQLRQARALVPRAGEP